MYLPAPEEHRQEWRPETADRALAGLLASLAALKTGVDLGELATAGRSRAPVSLARQIAMYLAHTSLSWPHRRVGQAFGRDRSTASHACQRVEALRDDPQFDEDLSGLEMCLQHVPLPKRLDRDLHR